MTELYKILNNIQVELKAPKGQYNSFGRYKYRSCEDILEALKPLLSVYKAILVLDDELVHIGDRYYIKSTATLSTTVLTEDANSISCCGYAREELSKKGMDGSQITGACSSYARKYALNGLFLIDDNKDSDATNTHGQGNQREKLKSVVNELNKEASEEIKKQREEKINQAYITISDAITNCKKEELEKLKEVYNYKWNYLKKYSKENFNSLVNLFNNKKG